MTLRRAAMRRRRRRRALAVATVLVAAAPLALWARSGPPGSGSPTAADAPASPPSALVVRLGAERRRRVDLTPAVKGEALDPARVRSIVAEELPRRWIARAGRSTIVYRLDPAAAVRAALRGTGPSVQVAARPVASDIRAPVVAQRLRNNCESAALEVLLATVGRRTPQLELQAALPVSGEPDPVGEGPSRVWGDPEVGYVGRPDGGGIAGGFGVFQGPVMQVARQHGVRLDDLSGAATARVVERVRSGSAVMVWIGLSDGPYGEWRSPEGRPVRVNFGEHTVVLTGVTEDGRLRVVNPLEGTRELWTREQFEGMWRLLDRRAVGVPLAAVPLPPDDVDVDQSPGATTTPVRG